MRSLKAVTRAVVMLCLVCSATGCHDLVAGGDDSASQLIWRKSIDVETGWHGVPALADNRLILASHGEMSARDTRSGTLLWRAPFDSDLLLPASVVTWRGTVYAAATAGIVAFDITNGEQRWSVVPDDSSSSGTENLADELALYVGTRSHRVHALRHADGSLLWSADIGPSWDQLGVVQGIARSGDTLYVTATRLLDAAWLHPRGVVVALDRHSGKELWRYETSGAGGYDAAASVAGDLILLADQDGDAFVAIDRWSGRELWRTPTDAEFLGPRAAPIARDGRVYAVARDGYAYALRLQDGGVVWRTHTGASNISLALCGSALLAQSQGVAILDATTGRLRRVLFDDPDDFTTSGIVVSGRRAYTAGTQAVYAFRCE